MPVIIPPDRYCNQKNCVRLAAYGRMKCNTCRERNRAARNPMRYTYCQLKKNARRRGINFELTFEEFEAFCVRTDYMNRKGTFADDLTIDRKNPLLGYTAGNIQALTASENSKKWITEDVKKVLRAKHVRRTKEEAGTPF